MYMIVILYTYIYIISGFCPGIPEWWPKVNMNRYAMCCIRMSVCYIRTYTTLAWVFKGAARCLTCILPGKYQDIARAISWESGLPMTLISSQFKEMMRFDSY